MIMYKIMGNGQMYYFTYSIYLKRTVNIFNEKMESVLTSKNWEPFFPNNEREWPTEAWEMAWLNETYTCGTMYKSTIC